MSAPLVVGAVCGRPECGHGEDLHDGICFGTACECVRFVESAGALPMPVLPEPQAPAEAFVPQTERSRWVAIADALNAAHAAGMPVGIDMDGTLTDHNAWSVVWDRSAERWTVAGHEDGFPALDEASRKSFAERADRETNPGRRAAWRMLAQDVTDGEHYAQVHHTYKVGHDLPELGGTQ